MIVPSQCHNNKFKSIIFNVKFPALSESSIQNRGFHFKKWPRPSNELENLYEGQGHEYRKMTPTVVDNFGYSVVLQMTSKIYLEVKVMSTEK